MLGIYIHIPFCVRKCDYCDFYSIPIERSGVPVGGYLSAVERQLGRDVKNLNLEGRRVESVYFGGGTPSLMPPHFFKEILDGIDRRFSVADDVEISCEANPATADSDWLKKIKLVGVTRISIGIQSFHPRLLSNLGRIHTSDDGMRFIAEAEDAGFGAVGLDLMFGIPGESVSDLEEDVKIAMTFQPQHLSVYQLTLEDETPLKRKFEESILDPVSEGDALRQMRVAARMLGRGGWGRYEISNFARPGFECRHNVNYWTYGEYLGLGAGATSFVRTEGKGSFGKRWTETKDIQSYLSGAQGVLESEEIAGDTAMSEFCFLGLRMTGGIGRDEFEKLFGVEFDRIYARACEGLVLDGLLSDDGRRLKLTERGLELSNLVFEKFIL